MIIEKITGRKKIYQRKRMKEFHKPVLLKESLDLLKVIKGEKYIDATIGGGGHSQAILKLGGILLGIDCDPEAIEVAREQLSQACPSPKFRGSNASWHLAQDNFARLKEIAENEGFIPAAGILFDLGVSSYQLESSNRGFSFSREGPLDMRMDPNLKVTAADLINGLNKGELNELFTKLGEENYSGRIAAAICRARRVKPILSCRQLAEIIIKAVPKRVHFDRIHPATRCFMGLRIAVNDEFNNLKKALPQALEILRPGGRLAVISFHSGEDRIVKQFLVDADKQGWLRIITEKPIRPGKEEIQHNPRCRSAKLRAAEKN